MAISRQRPLAGLSACIVRPLSLPFESVPLGREAFPIVYPGTVGVCGMLLETEARERTSPSASLIRGGVGEADRAKCFEWDRNVRAQA